MFVYMSRYFVEVIYDVDFCLMAKTFSLEHVRKSRPYVCKEHASYHCVLVCYGKHLQQRNQDNILFSR